MGLGVHTWRQELEIYHTYNKISKSKKEWMKRRKDGNMENMNGRDGRKLSINERNRCTKRKKKGDYVGNVYFFNTLHLNTDTCPLLALTNVNHEFKIQ